MRRALVTGAPALHDAPKACAAAMGDAIRQKIPVLPPRSKR
jgi:hypothetical protein